MMLDKEEVSVLNRTNKDMRVTLVVEVEYATYKLSSNTHTRYDDYNYPRRRRIKVILDEASGGEE